MKRLLFITGIILLATTGFSQKLAQLSLSNYGSSVVITFLVDGVVFVNITPDGKIIDWGIEDRGYQSHSTPPKLEKYMGKEEYYSATDSEAIRGKVKYIGRTAFTYYSAVENEKWAGKIKNIGPVLFDYYPLYEDVAFRGNIKNAGAVLFSWFGSYENAAYKGKIKSVGTTSITYYGSFDDKAFRGKIKTIDRQQFIYYSSYDRREYSGSLKTGYRVLLFNGIKYFIN